ncbi:MAG: hypothetical protein SFV51_07415 [Bryobacteraceae bacterium]|nr:hypothetical protein [Bryobacteraceae bacterium]
MNLALIGYGNVARSFARLLASKRAQYPFRIVAAHTRHGTAIDPAGLPPDPAFGPRLASVEEFLDNANAEIVVELTPLNPLNGEPAISHIRAAFARGLHVVTANKGPLAHAYAALREEARQRGVQFRHESTVMDGVPVFNMVRAGMPGCEIRGFVAVLNSTTNLVLEAMERGQTLEEGIEQARKLGITEADSDYDIDGWDAAAKAAALANVLMGAQVTPQDVDTKGIRRLTPEKLAELKAKGKTVRLITRARRGPDGVKLRVRAEVLDSTDTLANVRGTGNMLLLETDLLGTVGTLSVAPTIEETAYGLFSDLVDIARSL